MTNRIQDPDCWLPALSPLYAKRDQEFLRAMLRIGFTADHDWYRMYFRAVKVLKRQQSKR